MCTPMPPSHGGSLPAMDPYGKVVTAMRRPALILAGAAAVAAIAHAFWAPFPASGGNPVLDLIAYHDPGFHTVIRGWYYVAPAISPAARQFASTSAEAESPDSLRRSGRDGAQPDQGGGAVYGS